MKEPNKFENMSLRELRRMVPKVSYGKEARMLHRALKKYGDGLPLYGRYPMVPIYAATIAVIVAIIALLV